MDFLVVTAARWDVIGEKEKDELLSKVEKHFAYKGDKEPQALDSIYPAERLEVELKSIVKLYLLAKGHQHSQA
jgi:hypothetical protein